MKVKALFDISCESWLKSNKKLDRIFVAKIYFLLIHEVMLNRSSCYIKRKDLTLSLPAKIQWIETVSKRLSVVFLYDIARYFIDFQIVQSRFDYEHFWENEIG